MKKILTRNVPLKILSFFLATFLWVVIMNIEDPYITRTISDIKVVTQNTSVLEDNSKIYEIESGEYVSIKIRGKRSVVGGLTSNDFEATADFKKLSIVDAIPIEVKPKASGSYRESDIEILGQTQMMTISWEESDTQPFRVEVRTNGEPAEGYYVTDLVANPNMIEVSGSKKKIAMIRKVVVDISVNKASESFEVTAVPKALDENGYVIDDSKLDIKTKEIPVAVTILPTKEISIIVTTNGTPYYGYTCTKTQYDPLTVTIAGKQEDLDKIGYLTIPVNISLSKETIVETKNISEYLDPVYEIVDDNNSIAITAVIEKQESKDIIFPGNSVEIRNLSEDYVAEIKTPGTITFHVLGTADTIGQVTEENVKPYIDLKDMEAGTHSVTVMTAEIEGVTIRPVTISVEIGNKDIE